MRRILMGGAVLALSASMIAGCGAGADVSAEGVKTKEEQIDAATKKLNGGKTPDQGQGQGQDSQ